MDKDSEKPKGGEEGIGSMPPIRRMRKSGDTIRRIRDRAHQVEKASPELTELEEVSFDDLPEELVEKLYNENNDLTWSEKDIEEGLNLGFSAEDVRTAIDSGYLPAGLKMQVLEGLIERAGLTPYED